MLRQANHLKFSPPPGLVQKPLDNIRVKGGNSCRNLNDSVDENIKVAQQSIAD